MSRFDLRGVCRVFVGLAALGAIALTPAGGAAASGGTVPTSENPSSTSNELYGVSALSPTDAWAVGEYRDDATGAYRSLILHWNGTAWTKVGSPNVSSTNNVLTSVTAIGTANAWAVGSYVDDATRASRTLVLRWNGTAWTKVGSPNPSSRQNFLRGVGGGGSAGGIWAVGYERNNATGALETLALRWNGSKMVLVPSNAPDSATNIYNGVRASASSNAWAVGSAGPNALVSHWNGSTWARVKSPNPMETNVLMATNAASASDAWAVGYGSVTSAAETLAMHWNGSTWSTVPTPNPTGFNNLLVGVRAISATNAWAVGYSDVDVLGHTSTMILHWNGTDWTQSPTPSPGAQFNYLKGVATVTADDMWAVGFYGDVAAGARETLILHWDGTRWRQT
jgi:hypothetical protein